jgi:hypothetical protein
MQRRGRRVPRLCRRVGIGCSSARRILLSSLASRVLLLKIDRMQARVARVPPRPALTAALHEACCTAPIDETTVGKSTMPGSPNQGNACRPGPKSASGDISAHCFATHSLEWSCVESSCYYLSPSFSLPILPEGVSCGGVESFRQEVQTWLLCHGENSTRLGNPRAGLHSAHVGSNWAR